MKSFILILGLFVGIIFISGCSNTEINQTINGKKEGMRSIAGGDGCTDKGIFINDKKNGNWYTSCGNGSFVKGDYLNDKKEGVWIINMISDGKSYVGGGKYKNGKKEGEWLLWLPESDMLIKLNGYFENDKMEGIRNSEYPNGNKLIENFESGVRNGISPLFDKEGNFISATYYKNGVIVEGKDEIMKELKKDLDKK